MKVIGWQLARLVAEAQGELVGGSVEQIRRSPDRTRLALVVGSARGRTYVIIGVRGEAAAFYWTRHRNTVPGWAAYERTEVFNRLRSARLIGIGMAATDRIVRFEFERTAGDDESSRHYALVVGWIGSMSNARLVDSKDSHVLERFHADSEREQASHSKELQLPPPPDLADWRALTIPQYRTLRKASSDLLFADFMRRKLWGVDTGLARQITERFRELRAEADSLTAPPDSVQYWAEFQALIEIGKTAIDPETRLILPDGAGDPADIRLAPETEEAQTSLAELLALCDSRQPRERPESDERRRLYAAIETALRKNERRLASLDRTLAEEGRSAEYKRHGDLLSANRQMLKKGQSTLEVSDWETGAAVPIALDPARSPQQNIDDYYRKSRKSADATKAALAEMPHLRRERERLRAALLRLDSEVDSPDAANAIVASLGWDSNVKIAARNQTAPRLPYREFALGKERLWVGRSSRDNDELTLRFARPQDLFFHVHGSPGSHVILKRDSKDAAVDKDTITQAAQIAAFFSRAKHAGLVPVVYTETRFVRKPRKAPAGTVSVEREKTIMVRPLPPPGYHEKNPPN